MSDDWKLKATPVVRLKRPDKSFVYFVGLVCYVCTRKAVNVV